MELKFEITEELGILSENEKGWRKELNLVSWNEREPKYDIRDWNPSHERMSKGITLTKEEAQALYEILKFYSHKTTTRQIPSFEIPFLGVKGALLRLRLVTAS